ncbi:MAG TPA: glycosyltransferase family 2 protein [Elusimicrobiota bacterium]|nr:glycosyltransferase family 2 protein [Elusimicrobiota bacterium]
MAKPVFLVVPDGPAVPHATLARLARALAALGPVRPGRPHGLEHALGRAHKAGCRAAVVVDGATAIECIERIALNAPRLPVALVRFSPGPAAWSPRFYPGTGTPEAVWDFSEPGGGDWSRCVESALADLLAPPAPPDSALTSLVIPCWNGLGYTKQCWKSVARWTDRPFEAIFVDNGSTDGTGAWLRGLRDPRVRVISNKRNLGFARAVNQGLAAARGRWVVWLNNDVVVTPGWLGRLVDCARRHPRAGAVGPFTNSINGLQRADIGAYTMRSLPLAAEAWALRHAGQARSVHRLTGFCLLHPREALAAVGGLDERFGLGCYEDFDFCLRLVQAGRELLLAEDAFVHHHGNKSFTENRVSSRHVETNRRVFVDKWCHKSLAFLDHLDRELERR